MAGGSCDSGGISTALAASSRARKWGSSIKRLLDRDHAGGGVARVDRLHQSIAVLERRALVDVTLVGDLADVDRRRIGHDHELADPARGAAGGGVERGQLVLQNG